LKETGIGAALVPVCINSGLATDFPVILQF